LFTSADKTCVIVLTESKKNVTRKFPFIVMTDPVWLLLLLLLLVLLVVVVVVVGRQNLYEIVAKGMIQ
jgi:hypothetical protein